MTGPYRCLLRVPGARGFVLAGLVGRLATPMRAVSVVLLVQAATGSYAVAGAVSATLFLSFALGAPGVARLVDRHGQFRVLLVGTAVHVLALSGLLLAALVTAPQWTLFVSAAVAGPSVPQLSALMQARWAHLLVDRAVLPPGVAGPGASALQAAFALTAMLEEVAFVAGPVLAVAAATAVSPAASLGLVIALTAVGAGAFAAQRGTEPPHRPPAPSQRSALGSPRLRLLAGAFLPVGAVFAMVDLALLGFTVEQGQPGTAGVLLGLVAAGSLGGGYWYGRRGEQAAPELQFRRTMAVFAAGVAPLVLAPGLPGMALAALLAGVAIAPNAIAGAALVQRLVPASARTEGFTWLATAAVLGNAAGAALAGYLLDAASARTVLALAAAVAAAAAAVPQLGRARLTPSTRA